MDYELLTGSLIGLIVIFIVIRLIFRTSKEESLYKVSSDDLDFEIQNLRHHLKRKKKLTKEDGELMDHLLEEYYKKLEEEKINKKI